MENQKQVQVPDKKELPQKSPQNQFIWVVLGIAAILLIWLLSSRVYK